MNVPRWAIVFWFTLNFLGWYCAVVQFYKTWRLRQLIRQLEVGLTLYRQKIEFYEAERKESASVQ
jgi:hypothetical protein